MMNGVNPQRKALGKTERTGFLALTGFFTLS